MRGCNKNKKQGGINIKNTTNRVTNIDVSVMEHIPIENLVNLLAHPIRIKISQTQYIEIPPSGTFLRLIMTEVQCATAGEIPVRQDAYIHSSALPAPDGVHYYIVPRKIAGIYHDRDDLLYPYANSRDPLSTEGVLEYLGLRRPDTLIR